MVDASLVSEHERERDWINTQIHIVDLEVEHPRSTDMYGRILQLGIQGAQACMEGSCSWASKEHRHVWKDLEVRYPRSKGMYGWILLFIIQGAQTCMEGS